jgi:2,5-diketo-D-gluconate reductase B
MNGPIKAVNLGCGHFMPVVGLGTWSLRGIECQRVVRTALELGYRHFDTAEKYENESEIGQALKEFPVVRRDLFLTSKVWRNHLKPDLLAAAAEASLKRLQVDYLDLLLVHVPSQTIRIEETLQAMVSLQSQGKVRAIGLSNFSLEETRRCLDEIQVPIACCQIKFSPFHIDRALVEFLRVRGVAITAYSPLAKGAVNGNPVLRRIALNLGKSECQVALRWLLHQGATVVPKASTRAHLEENLQVIDFDLQQGIRDEIEELAASNG